MINEFGIKLLDMLLLYTHLAGELDRKLKLHHQRTAYIAYRIARRCGLSEGELEKILCAALIHDIGIITSQNENGQWHYFDMDDFGNHAKVGGFLAEQSAVLRPMADMIAYHHMSYEDRDQMNALSDGDRELQYILYLADHMTTLISDNTPIAFQKEDILDRMVENKGTMFKPELIEVLLEVEKKEAFWLELHSGDMFDYLKYHQIDFIHPLTIDEVMDVGRVIVFAVDYRQTYTAAHSIAASRLAEELAKGLGLDHHDQLIAALGMLLHDIGKIKVEPAILNHPHELMQEEYELIQSHPFVGRKLINDCLHLPQVAKMIAHHHERMDGSGYPFKLQGHELSQLDKIGAIADVVSAMMEERPYRKKHSPEDVRAEVQNLVYSRKLDGAVFKVLDQGYEDLVATMQELMTETYDSYRKLLEIMMNGDVD